MSKYSQEIIVNYLKTYGFVFPNSEIYGGLANAWDYGPIGTLLKNNLKALWWKEFVTKVPNAIGLDSTIINNPRIYKASGHISNFNDPLIDCKSCKQRYRADKLINESLKNGVKVSEATPLKQLKEIISSNHIKCPNCGKETWTDVRQFNLMFKTFQGVLEDENTTLYLRPETCQNIFVDFMSIARTSRLKLPFSVCQIGKSFRNEITPGNFIFRTREFEQAEMEYFTNPSDSLEEFDELLEKVKMFLFNTLQMNEANFKYYDVKKTELAHYSKKTIDIEYDFPHGYSELWGIAHRGQFDFLNHIEASGKDIYYLDTNGAKIIPQVIEPSVGIDRLFYAIICDKYEVEKLSDNEEREVLHLPISLSPYKFSVLPLNNKLNSEAYALFLKIIGKGISCSFDASGSIGKRYRRQDAIGTPYCITYDFDSGQKRTVTIRERDSMKQETINIEELFNFINVKLM